MLKKIALVGMFSIASVVSMAAGPAPAKSAGKTLSVGSPVVKGLPFCGGMICH
jgi:hypothetical protein